MNSALIVPSLLTITHFALGEDGGAFEGCSLGDYYLDVDPTDRNSLGALLTETHRQVLPYTSSSEPDVWDAIRVLDAGSEPDTVHVIYGQKDVSVELQGSFEGYNREHLWPRSYGIGDNGADYTDVHHIFPADWNVNSARSNKLFGPCTESDDCRSPAHSEAATDTETGSSSFLPPAIVRGDIARALFYMDVRYSGAVDDETDLYLTDCPGGQSSMGFLSHLLQWHVQDPVSDEEMARNNGVCSTWQGNRNPFIDFPDLVTAYFGVAQENVSCTDGAIDGGIDGENNGGTGSAGETGSTGGTGDEDSGGTSQLPYEEPTGNPPFAECTRETFYSSLSSMVSPTRSELERLVQQSHRRRIPWGSLDDTDSVWAALADLYSAGGSNIELVFSDDVVNVDTGDTAVGWVPDQLWPRSRGIETTGLDATDLHNLVPTQFTVDQARGGRAFGACPSEGNACTTPATAFTASDTALSRNTFLPPARVRGDIARALFYMDLRYSGHMEREEDLTLVDCLGGSGGSEYGIRSELLQWHIQDGVSDEERQRNDKICELYQGTRNPFVDMPQLVSIYFGAPKNDPCNFEFDPELDRSPTCPSTGSIMVVEMNSDYPDRLALLALEDIVGGTILYVTDNSWTGTELRNTEGYLRFQVPSAGITAGTVFGYDQPTDSLAQGIFADYEFERIRGSFDLSQAGDTVLIVCDGQREGLIFITGFTFANRWADYGGDTTYSVLPKQLEQVKYSYVTLAHFDNYRYRGSAEGTAFRLREAIADPSNWEGGNEQRYDDLMREFVVLPPVPGEDTEPPTLSPVEAPTFITTATSGGISIHVWCYLSLSFFFSRG